MARSITWHCTGHYHPETHIVGDLKNKKHTGTLITFLPDPTIFNITTEFQFAKLAGCASWPFLIRPGDQSD